MPETDDPLAEYRPDTTDFTTQDVINQIKTSYDDGDVTDTRDDEPSVSARVESAVHSATNSAVGRHARPWLVVDFGSRAVGLDHDGSDRDVFVVYDQPAGWYKYGMETESFMETADTEPFDIQGHSTGKFISGVCDADPMSIEALRSPITYYMNPDVSGARTILQNMAEQSVERVSLFYHYRSFAESNYRQYIENGNDPTVHRWTQVCRACLSAQYILYNGELPPMDVDTLLDEMSGHSVTANEAETIRRLFELKRDGEGEQQVEWASTELSNVVTDVLSMDLAHDKYDYDGVSADARREAIRFVDRRL